VPIRDRRPELYREILQCPGADGRNQMSLRSYSRFRLASSSAQRKLLSETVEIYTLTSLSLASISGATRSRWPTFIPATKYYQRRWDSGGQDEKSTPPSAATLTFIRKAASLMGPFYIEEAELATPWSFISIKCVEPQLGVHFVSADSNAVASPAESPIRTFTRWMQCGRSAPTHSLGSRISTPRPPVPCCSPNRHFQFNLPVSRCWGAADRHPPPAMKVLTSGPAAATRNMDYNDVA